MVMKITERCELSKLIKAIILLVIVLYTLASSASFANWYPKCNQIEVYPDMCCWSGTAPVCLAGCPSGYNKERTSKDADGDLSYCTVGTHKLCCPSGLSGKNDSTKTLYVNNLKQGSLCPTPHEGIAGTYKMW
ncbi:hypothetical protein [Nitrosomonas sp.]|uniref:hypothetical protein n=1 Tax=Nitrosomonas sp. TaxID=42353 RepID=UPI001E18941A|nr:hypothetical protein [Nitrosomonas sp.]MBX3618088.1 hypothetical protein [Nitrosomonas sp.]